MKSLSLLSAVFFVCALALFSLVLANETETLPSTQEGGEIQRLPNEVAGNIDYSCTPPLSTLGGLCIKCEDGYAGQTYVKMSTENRCIHVPKLKLKPNIPASCRASVMGMFFSWVAYEQDPKKTMGRAFSTSDQPRLNGCPGTFYVRNEFHYEGLDYNVHSSVFVNDQMGIAIIAFRGTEFSFDRLIQTLVDWINGNLQVQLDPCPFPTQCGRIHRGFLNQYLKQRDFLVAQITKYIDAGYAIYATGHSQGAALSTVAGLHWKVVFPSTKITVVNFASPRVGDDNFVKAFDNSGIVMAGRYVSVNPDKNLDATDIVTTIPPPVPLPYRHVAGEVIIPCYPKYFGNPNPISGVPMGGPSIVPNGLGCHYQEVYMDGIIDSGK